MASCSQPFFLWIACPSHSKRHVIHKKRGWATRTSLYWTSIRSSLRQTLLQMWNWQRHGLMEGLIVWSICWSTPRNIALPHGGYIASSWMLLCMVQKCDAQHRTPTVKPLMQTRHLELVQVMCRIPCNLSCMFLMIKNFLSSYWLTSSISAHRKLLMHQQYVKSTHYEHLCLGSHLLLPYDPGPPPHPGFYPHPISHKL